MWSVFFLALFAQNRYGRNEQYERSWRSWRSRKSHQGTDRTAESAIESSSSSLPDLSRKIDGGCKRKYDILGITEAEHCAAETDCRPSSSHWTRFRACPSKTCSKRKSEVAVQQARIRR